MRKVRQQSIPLLRLSEEEGICVIICAFFLLGIVTIVGLATDAGRLFVDGMCTQLASDAGALVGAAHIGDLTDSEIEVLAREVTMDNLEINRVAYDPNDIVALPGDQIISIETVGRSKTAILGSLFGGRLDWSFTRRAVGERRPAAIAVVADTSGSMQGRASVGGEETSGYTGTRLEALVLAGKTFLNAADPNQDAVAIVSFSANAQVIYPMSHPFSNDDINDALVGLSAGDTTNINAGIKAGIDEILKLRTMTDSEGNRLNYDAFVKILLLITDGVPKKHNVSFPPGELDPVPYPSDCPSGSSKKDFLWPILRADFARENGIMVYTIGLGVPDPNTRRWNQGGTGVDKLKTFFMRRMANDSQAGTEDPPFPRCITPYDEMLNKPMAEYQSSPSGNDLLRMFNRIYRVTRMRLLS